jgi:hypothetical protein
MDNNIMHGTGTYYYISGNATNQVVSGQARLHSLTINKALTGTVKIIDGTSGTTANVATITNSSGPIGTLWYNCTMTKGILIVCSASEDITVVWKN